MYFNILKKDLKRKKTMNVILLLFAILASMFVSSGISNVVNVMNGTEYFLESAGIGDYIIITQNGDGGVTELLDNLECVDSYKVEAGYWGNKENIKIDGHSIELKSSTIEIQNISETGIKFFDMNNEELKSIKTGTVYVTSGFLDMNDAKVGDIITVDYHGVDKTLEIAGEMKDALLGSDMMGNTRFLVSDEEFADFDNEETQAYKGYIFYVNSENISDVKDAVANAENVLFTGNRSMIKLTFVMEMIVAMIVLVLSVCLCIVSFVLLRFVITFTISEEFREIGVMKAIGIKNFKIRGIYLTKYFAMALVGGCIGLAAGVPFGKVLLSSVSKKMVLSNDFGIMLNIFGALIVVFIMTGFAYLCTGKVKKYTPVDAIRSGSTGERYKKKSKMSIRKSHMSNAFFMAANDILSAPKRFLTIILSFFLCSVFVFGVVEVADTMLSDRLITSFGKRSDVYITSSDLLNMEFMSEAGNENVDKLVTDIENTLKELGMPGKANFEIWYKYKATVDGKTTSLNCMQNKYIKTTDYEYMEGSAPQSVNEIAITKQISEEIGAKLGDVVEIDYGTEKIQCTVVAYFQTMNQLGSVIRIHEDAPTDMIYANVMASIQIDFDDNPSDKVIDERIKTLKEHYGVDDIFNAAEYCDDCMKVGSTMRAVQYLLLVITCLIVILVTVLMERSFISDETSQIALLKAIGFTDSFIIKWQVARFMMVAIASELLAIALTYPITKLWCDPIWKMMGALNVNYYFKPLSLLVIYPGIILAINFVSAYLTARISKKITSNEMGNVE